MITPNDITITTTEKTDFSTAVRAVFNCEASIHINKFSMVDEQMLDDARRHVARALMHKAYGDLQKQACLARHEVMKLLQRSLRVPLEDIDRIEALFAPLIHAGDI